ncbi:MAG TPA: Dam family site-specific DNA-(adenine-N6)-methyltransferase, partial [Anaerolineae bacterium]|nr:Dam family site-specific DNA-(adenine-N6)-methyltransferase [Anaerolineae bacterium]
GEFNVPMGSSVNPRVFDEDQLRATSRALQGASICNLDFSAVLDEAKKGDLVYFDPPYHTDTNGFTGYTVSALGRAGFGAREQRRLANVVDQLTERGCYVVVSNSSTKFIQHLYYDYNVYTVHARRVINSDANGRGLVKEVIITNYGKDSH